MARLNAEDKARNEAAIRAAMDRILGGSLPEGGKCDLKTLAEQAGVQRTGFYPKKNRDGTIRTGPYQHLAEEFERRLKALIDAGTVVDLRAAHPRCRSRGNYRGADRVQDHRDLSAGRPARRDRAPA